jgi:dipeptidyl aminopeptidase/acylaminoacyl peptidase
VTQVMARATAPARLWIVPARDHRFSDNRAQFEASLTEALAWIGQNRPR